MNPLANAGLRRVFRKASKGALGAAVFTQDSHIEMPVIRRSFRFSMPGGSGPRFRQIVKAVPVKPVGSPEKQFHGALQSPFLNLFGAKCRNAHLGYPDRKLADCL